MNPDTVKSWVEQWIDRGAPSSESLGGERCGAERTWSQLDSIDEIREEGDLIKTRFTWSRHRESEHTVYTDLGEESLMTRETTDLAFDRQGKVVK